MIELVEPSVRWVDEYLFTTGSPGCLNDPPARVSRRELLRFVDKYPRGRQTENPATGHAHGYTFWIRRVKPVAVRIAGTVSLRIGEDENLRFYLGHVGYGVFTPARGHRIAERATRLLFPLALAHGMSELWITANPDNYASRTTCERLGATLVDVVDLPPTHPLALRGETRKCRYRIDLVAATKDASSVPIAPR